MADRNTKKVLVRLHTVHAKIQYYPNEQHQTNTFSKQYNIRPRDTIYLYRTLAKIRPRKAG